MKGKRPCKKILGGTCTEPSCDFWHFPVFLDHKSECGDKYMVTIVSFCTLRLLISPTKSQRKKSGAKGSLKDTIQLGCVSHDSPATQANSFHLKPSSTQAKFSFGQVLLWPIFFLCVRCVCCVRVCVRQAFLRMTSSAGLSLRQTPLRFTPLRWTPYHRPPKVCVWACRPWDSHKMIPEKPKRTLWVVHGRGPRPQFHEKTSQERKNSENAAGEEKTRNFGPPTLRVFMTAATDSNACTPIPPATPLQQKRPPWTVLAAMSRFELPAAACQLPTGLPVVAP